MIVKIGDYELNRYYFEDALEALKKIPNNSFDLCLTDPPYNVDVGCLGADRMRITPGARKANYNFYDKKKKYDDVIADYENFCKAWFTEVKRVCTKIVFTPGTSNFCTWIKIEEPKEILIHYKPDCVGFTHSIRFLKHEYILCYGKFRPFEFKNSVITTQLGSEETKRLGIEHASPKAIQLWRILLSRIKPRTVLDPFVGSGTTIQACIEQGIDYLCFEIDKAYESDILKRVHSAVKMPKTKQIKAI